MVSASSTTGAKDSFSPGQIAYFERIRDMKLKNPCLIGFGIASRETFSVACQYSNGAIIGSAFVKMLEGEENLPAAIHAFCKKIKAS
jgi:tryptophan synthase alpha chain